MHLSNTRIEIVSSTKTGLSSMSHESRSNILAVLRRHYTKVRITIINDLSDLHALAARKPDLVFLGMKFLPKNPKLGFHDTKKLWISSYLDAQGIAYTGSSWLAHELELNKHMAKVRVASAGLQTSPFCIARQNHPLTPANITLKYPVFIKPTNRGGGAGIDSASVAIDFESLRLKVASITMRLRSDSLIEEYLPGREFSVTIMKRENSAALTVLPLELVAEADAHGVRMLGLAVKTANSERVLEVSDTHIRSTVCKLATSAFTALGARDYGRIDIRLDANNIPHFLEANLMPSLISGYGTFPKACVLGLSLDYEAMILHIVALGMTRAHVTSLDTPEPCPTNDFVLEPL